MYQEHYVMMCIGKRVNAAFISYNFDIVSWELEFMIYQLKLFKHVVF